MTTIADLGALGSLGAFGSERRGSTATSARAR